MSWSSCQQPVMEGCQSEGECRQGVRDMSLCDTFVEL